MQSMRSRVITVAVIFEASVSASVHGQAELVGRVFTDSARTPVPGAIALFPALGRTTTTDSLGRFRLTGLPQGAYQLVLHATGYAPDSSTIALAGDDVVAMEFRLRAIATPLPARTVTGREMPLATGKMAGFYERQKRGGGRFITREILAKAEAAGRTSDVLAGVPGISVKRGQSKAWVASGRAANTGSRCAFCPDTAESINPSDFAAGARPACYVDIFIDGTLIYTDKDRPAALLFDVNSIPPAQIEGIEVYASAAQIPSQYNRTSTVCGAMLIWTR